MGDACDPCTDADSDTYGSGGSCAGPDCNDNSGSIHAPLNYFNDEDGDGVTLGGAVALCSLTAPPGFSSSTNGADNCPVVSNPTQSDSDGDLVGDACDPTPGTAGTSTWFDPFDGSSFLSGWSERVGESSPTGTGEYRKGDNEKDGLFLRAFAASADVVVSADLTLTDLDGGSPPNRVGVVARADAAAPYAGFACAVSRDSSAAATVRILEVSRTDSENVNTLATLQSVALTPVPADGAGYLVVFELLGSNLTCTVTPDGQSPVVVSHTSTAHASSTGVGIYARNAEIHADWFLVTTR